MTEIENKKLAEHLANLVRQASVQRLSSYTYISNLKKEEHPRNLPVFGHWMSLILIASPEVKIIFKVYFMTQKAGPFLQKLYGSKKYQFTPEQVRDFIKEYCNLTAGALKGAFGDQKISSGLSLPVVGRGFDEIFSPTPNLETSFQDVWKLSSEEGELCCGSWIELNEPNALYTFDWEAAEKSFSETKEVEFL